MGANFQSFTVDGSKTTQEVRAHFRKEQEKALHEHGSDRYNGTISTLSGIEFPSQAVFADVDAAVTWLEENTDKWETAKAVKAKDIVTQEVTRPTFNGQKHTYNSTGFKSGCYLRESFATTASVFAPADQLTDTQKSKLTKLHDTFLATKEVYDKTHTVFHTLDLALRNMEEDFTEYKGLKAARNTHAKAHRAVVKARAALMEYDTQLAQKLYTDKIVDKGEVWVIGGWCAE